MNTETKYEIGDFIHDLNTCLSKFKESCNGDLSPILSTRWDLKMMSEQCDVKINQDDFIYLSDGQVLGIKKWKEHPQSFLNIKAFEYDNPATNLE